MTLTAGRRLGPYEILSPLGAGGMGVVYRARDTRLGRDVAIKVLAETVATDAPRLRRLEKEARAASALNHPNIVTVHEIGEADSLVFMVMELVEGRTLRQMFAVGEQVLPLKEALRVSGQIADGLAKAHEGGIVHRDLKPENVMVTPDGLVKILDFGLAKVADRRDRDEDAPTASEILTHPGTVMGTVGYMSPEQVRGETATAQSDQFSFGCIVFEVLSGRRAWSGASSADTLSAILRDEAPSLDATNPQVPAPLSWIVERCLAKAPRERYHSTADLARDLNTLREHSGQLSIRRPIATKAAHSFRRIAGWAAAVVGGAALALAANAWLRPRPVPEFRRLTFRDGVVSRALFAPDGLAVLYSAAWGDEPSRTFLTLPESSGLDRPLDGEQQLPMSYSEDGTEVLSLLGPPASLFTTNPKGTLAWWPALGGKPRRILENAGWADWGRKGRFLVAARDLGPERVLELANAGGETQRILFRTSGAIRFVRIAPDERSVAFIHHPLVNDDGGEVRVAPLDGAPGRALAGPFERVTGLDWNRATTDLWFTASPKTPYSSEVLAVSPRGGTPRSLQSLPDVYSLQSVAAAGDRCLVIWNESRVGMMAARGSQPPRDLSWMGWSLVADVSFDNKTVLFFDGGNTERAFGTWVRPLEGGDAVRLGDGTPGAFSRDGRFVVSTTAARSGARQLLVMPVGTGQTRRLDTGSGEATSPALEADHSVLFVHSENGKKEIRRVSLEGGVSRSLGVADCDYPSPHPDGSRFVCRGGAVQGEAWVFPAQGGPGHRILGLTGGLSFLALRWSQDGERLLAVTTGGRYLEIDPRQGRVLAESAVADLAGASRTKLVSAAISPDGSERLYSVLRTSSGLYMVRGLR